MGTCLHQLCRFALRRPKNLTIQISGSTRIKIGKMAEKRPSATPAALLPSSLPPSTIHRPLGYIPWRTTEQDNNVCFIWDDKVSLQTSTKGKTNVTCTRKDRLSSSLPGPHLRLPLFLNLPWQLGAQEAEDALGPVVNIEHTYHQEN